MKYDQRRAFAAPGDPNTWLNAKRIRLENGWYRFTDEDGTFYFAHEITGETSWDLPDDARPSVQQVNVKASRDDIVGWLEKKSGGNRDNKKIKFMQKWDRRWFVFPDDGRGVLSYYRSDVDASNGAEPLGVVICGGADLFLKNIGKDDQQYRFTLDTHERELKLRGSKDQWQLWSRALRPWVAKVGEDYGEEDD